MELSFDFDLDDLNDNDLNAIIEHLCVSANSTHVIGEFCEENIELIRQNVFTKFKELKVTVAIIKAYREKTNKMKLKMAKYDEKIQQLQDENNQLHYKIKIKDKLLNELLASDDNINENMNANINANINENINENNLLAAEKHLINSSMELTIDKNELYNLRSETSSSDFEHLFQSTNNHEVRNNGTIDEGFNFYVEKMQELCLRSKNLTKDERNLIEQLLAHFAEHTTQNKFINDFLSSNIEDAIKQKDDINYLLTEIEKLEDEKKTFMAANEQMTSHVHSLTGRLNEANDKLYNMAIKCEHYEGSLSRKHKISTNETSNEELHQSEPVGNNLNNCVNNSSGFSKSYSKAGESSAGDENDHSGRKKSSKKMTPTSAKFKLVKSMEGSSMLGKWKNLATTSRGLQITKELIKEDYIDDKNNEPSSNSINTDSQQTQPSKVTRKGPKIIPAVTRMGHLYQANKKTQVPIKKERAQSKNIGIVSRFGAIEDPFDILKPTSSPFSTPNSTPRKQTRIINQNNNNNLNSNMTNLNDANQENIPPSDNQQNSIIQNDKDQNEQLNQNQIEDLLKQLDSTFDNVNTNKNFINNNNTIMSNSVSKEIIPPSHKNQSDNIQNKNIQNKNIQNKNIQNKNIQNKNIQNKNIQKDNNENLNNHNLNNQNEQLNENQIEDLLKKLDSTFDNVMTNKSANQTLTKPFDNSHGVAADSDSKETNVYSGVKNFLSYLRSPFN